ncbi:MAG: S41 family peptidase [Defluviitaleaceae bacterium]|nr:S41 family peptidase [Defluviitaleaceae bacterium]
MEELREIRDLREIREDVSRERGAHRAHFIRGLIFGIVSVLIVLSAAFFVGGAGRPASTHVLDPSAKIQEIMAILESHSVNNFDIEVMTEAMFIGLLYGVGDPYTAYMDRRTLASFLENTEGRYAGIGVRVQLDPLDNRIQILQVFPNGPSAHVGLEPGDKIVRVNGTEVSGSNFDEAISMMRGTPATRVNLTILRAQAGTFDVEITRAEVEVPSVDHRMLDDEIGYIRISNFDRMTYPQFMTALNSLGQSNMRGLVIDVRNNPGGLLDSVVRITNELVPRGLIVYTEDKHGNREEMRGNSRQLDIPLVILVNENSASASEVLAGAVRDTGSGILVGNTTFGKGVVQSLFQLSDGSGIRVTVARYYTPGGYSIHGEGITPDILIPTDRETSMRIMSLEQWQDEQLTAAMDSLRANIGR